MSALFHGTSHAFAPGDRVGPSCADPEPEAGG
jgi:hypothetical protein